MKLSNCISALIFSVLSLIMYSCEQNDKPAEAVSAPDLPSEEKTTEPPAEKDLLYAWVDQLNIRDTPDLKGNTVATMQSDDALEFTGDQSDQIATIVLRGVAYDEPWLKVITPDKKEGWVYGGAVKRKEEQKGNDLITDLKFDFPHFGSYDLSSWKKLGTRTEGEEVDYKITTYQKGDRILEITNSDMGEFYYGYTHKLMDADKKVLKERALRFTTDPLSLEETVIDHTSNPPVQYLRQQKMNKHYYQLNARPVMVNGKWTKSPSN